ncbi:hypothetical protein R3P38DRAFT_3043416 [Favolaschia claudopus]|uniref:C2H2-type domain-containing protein n=1 Tax=Favolaschia claudopus TaxID=2862362 RepID=A0AAW0A7V9_9AGAR
MTWAQCDSPFPLPGSMSRVSENAYDWSLRDSTSLVGDMGNIGSHKPTQHHYDLRHHSFCASAMQQLSSCIPSNMCSTDVRRTRSENTQLGLSALPPHTCKSLRSAASSTRPSPYLSSNLSPTPYYIDFSNDGALPPLPSPVCKPEVTTALTQKASQNRRKYQPTCVCPVPKCGSTFTRSHNLKGHLRSHMNERPFLCRWPGCGKGFARQHDCTRHEQLHAKRGLNDSERITDFIATIKGQARCRSQQGSTVILTVR